MSTSGPEPPRAASAPRRPCRRLRARRACGSDGEVDAAPGLKIPRAAHHARGRCPGDRAVRISTGSLSRRGAVRGPRATRTRGGPLSDASACWPWSRSLSLTCTCLTLLVS